MLYIITKFTNFRWIARGSKVYCQVVNNFILLFLPAVYLRVHKEQFFFTISRLKIQWRTLIQTFSNNNKKSKREVISSQKKNKLWSTLTINNFYYLIALTKSMRRRKKEYFVNRNDNNKFFNGNKWCGVMINEPHGAGGLFGLV